jgi:hypothetical protein
VVIPPLYEVLARMGPQEPPPWSWSEVERIVGRSIDRYERIEIQSAVGRCLDRSWRNTLDPTGENRSRQRAANWSKYLRRLDSSRRPSARSFGIGIGALRPRGGRSTVKAFDDLIRALDRHFPELECKTNPNREGPQPFKGTFVDLVYEIVQQMKPLFRIASEEIPAAVDVSYPAISIAGKQRRLFASDSSPRRARKANISKTRQAEKNAIGRRIKKVRAEQRRKRS